MPGPAAVPVPLPAVPLPGVTPGSSTLIPSQTLFPFPVSVSPCRGGNGGKSSKIAAGNPGATGILSWKGPPEPGASSCVPWVTAACCWGTPRGLWPPTLLAREGTSTLGTPLGTPRPALEKDFGHSEPEGQHRPRSDPHGHGGQGMKPPRQQALACPAVRLWDVGAQPAGLGTLGTSPSLPSQHLNLSSRHKNHKSQIWGDAAFWSKSMRENLLEGPILVEKTQNFCGKSPGPPGVSPQGHQHRQSCPPPFQGKPPHLPRVSRGDFFWEEKKLWGRAARGWVWLAVRPLSMSSALSRASAFVGWSWGLWDLWDLWDGAAPGRVTIPGKSRDPFGHRVSSWDFS